MSTKELFEPITSFVCFDIETTGLNPEEDRIIEIGGIKVKDKKIVGQFREFINPEFALTSKIIDITNITDEMLKDAPKEEEVIKRFLDFVQDDILIGHNIPFDYSFIKIAASKLKLTFERFGIDTLVLSKKLHGTASSRSLENMCKLYNIKNEHAHRALDDAKATAMLYVHLCNEFFPYHKKEFSPKPLTYKVKKNRLITTKQKNYLIDLLKYHNIENIQSIETLSQSEASKLIDNIILNKGRII